MYGGNNHARVNRRSPSAWAICDFCGGQYNRVDLVADMQYMGREVMPTGYLVCKRTCLDRPQPQQKAIRIPPDPLPVADPRVDNFPNGNFGFTQYLLFNGTLPGGGLGGIGEFAIGIDGIGIGGPPPMPPQIYPTTEGGALLALAAISGIAIPLFTDRSTTIATSNAAQTFLPANPGRTWLAIYNPGGQQFAINTGTAAFGLLTNMMTGPGECWFWAAAQEMGTVYQGAMSVVSLQQGAPVWAWDA